jgi:hypothetical protein
MTADDLANCSTVGAHRAPLQLNALSSYLRDTTLGHGLVEQSGEEHTELWPLLAKANAGLERSLEQAMRLIWKEGSSPGMIRGALRAL